MSLQSVRLLDGSAVRLPGGVAQVIGAPVGKVNAQVYVYDEDGNDQLSRSPTSVPSNTVTRDCKLNGGDQLLLTK